MGGPVWGILAVSCARPDGHVTSLGDLVQRPRHNLPAGIPNGVLYQRPLVASRRDCVVWVKCTTSAECKTIRIAVSTIKDNTWIFLDVQDLSCLFPLCPYSWNLWRVWVDRGSSLEERYSGDKTRFHQKLLLSNCFICQTKLALCKWAIQPSFEATCSY